MKVCVDTNVLISYLLYPDKDTTSRKVIWAGLTGDIDLSINEGSIRELQDSIRSSRYLSDRIPTGFITEFVNGLRIRGMIEGDIDRDPPRVVRDANDDYLVAHTFRTGGDYIVTGDRDLLELKHDFGFQIITPAELLALLSADASES